MDNVILYLIKEIQMFFNIVNVLLITIAVIIVVAGILVVKNTEGLSVFEKRAIMVAGIVMLSLLATGIVEVRKAEKAYKAHRETFERNMKEIDTNLDKIERLLEKSK
jgi:hypothetical protein